jgi:acetate kinase
MAVLLGSQSVLKGISGTSGDVRDLEDAAAKGEKRARLALDGFVGSIRHYVGAFLLWMSSPSPAESVRTARGFARQF